MKLNKKRLTKSAKKRQPKRKLNYKKLFVAALSLLVFFILVGFLTLAYLLKDLPNIEEMAIRDVRPEVTLYDSNKVVLAKYGDFRGETLTYSNIPINMINAVVAAEDRRFFSHSGIDIIGIIRAYIVNIRAGKVVQGGSTITQQLAKIIYLTPKRTFKRKLQEIIIALELERKFSKEQILTLYLNRVYLGKGNYGIDAAAKYYFGKRGSDLSLYESAIIAGLLRAPSRYSPANNLSLAIGRGRQILMLMENEGYVPSEIVKNLKPPSIVERGIGRGVLKNPYFADYVLSEVAELIDDVIGDINIYTTLDIKAQEVLEQAISNNAKVAAEQYKAHQAAGVVMEFGGAIKAMVGGFNYAESQFNRAVVAKRQPGSSFKFFVYLAALENLINPYDVYVDEPISLKQGKGLPMWKPRNFDRKYRGAMTMEEAFSHSINTITVKISEQIGVDKVVEIAKRLGVNSYIPSLSSIALGTNELTLLEMVQAYAHVANNGQKVKAYAITKITDNNSDIIYEYTPTPSLQLIDGGVLEKMKGLLSSVVENGNGRNASIPGRRVYGKTGTTQEHRDAWFIGFVDGIVTGIWMGNDDDKPTKSLVGGTLPAKIFKEFNKNVGHIQPSVITNDSIPWRQESIFDTIFGSN